MMITALFIITLVPENTSNVVSIAEYIVPAVFLPTFVALCFSRARDEWRKGGGKGRKG